jgi:23S rRNA (uridine2552-2'-O)-methyltransferase
MKTPSSRRWLAEHVSDPFVKQAKKEGFRARSAYKLKEIQEKDKLIRPGMTVVDLGAAPGAWSQLAVSYLQGRGKIFALDILNMDPIPGVTFIQGDFREQSVFDELFSQVNQKVDLILSDLAPNLSGNRTMDQPRVMHLCDIALEFTQLALKPGGSFLIKIFQGAGFSEYLQQLRKHFDKVVSRKPDASRDRSSECYLLARGFRGSAL